MVSLTIVICSCSNEKVSEPPIDQAPSGVDIQATDSIREVFMLPDSINTNLIIATYVEIDPESHTLLMYTNTDKKKAQQIRYLNDGKVAIDPLDVVSETELRSKTNKYSYIITDSSVVFKMENGHFEEHYRTDANN